MDILIAEDDRVTRHMLQTALNKWGHEVVSTDEGARAWELFESGTAPRLAILDWMMPGIDGIELCRRIRSKQELKSMYVMLLTSRTGSSDLVEGLEAGANDYIAKPIKFAELQARLNVGI